MEHLTCTVGLISARHGTRFDVMAAEWTSFVARDPLHIAVAVATSNLTHELLGKHGQFAVTLCDTSLAATADLCGTFSGRELDKAGSAAVPLSPPTVIDVPHVTGGVLNAECVVRHVVDLPGYGLFIGEAVWVQVDEERSRHPLVKHGRMHELGPELARGQQVCVAVRLVEPGLLTVGAVVHAAPPGQGEWTLQVLDASGRVLLDETVAADGDLLQDLRLEQGAPAPARVRVGRTGCAAGDALVFTDVGPALGQDLLTLAGR